MHNNPGESDEKTMLREIIGTLQTMRHDDAEELQRLREKVAYTSMAVEHHMGKVKDLMMELRRAIPGG